jgi:hypothetical protein
MPLNSGNLCGVPIRPYGIPSSPSEYFADQSQPVDRWCQIGFSANSATVRRIICDVNGGVPAVIVDPYCGYGSTAVAARRLSVPFLGIDVDPLMTAVTSLKANLAVEDLPTLRSNIPRHMTVQWLGASGLGPFQRVVVEAALAGVLMHRSRVELLEQVRVDLIDWMYPPSDATIFCADSNELATWRAVKTAFRRPGAGGAVMFASPSFPGSANAAPRGAAWQIVRERVAKLYTAPQSGSPVVDRRSSEDVTLDVPSVLLNGIEALGPYVGIIEYEDPSPSMSGLASLTESVGALGRTEVREILKTRQFSSLGILYMLVIEGR